MKCVDCQLATQRGMLGAISAVSSAPDALVTGQLIESNFIELLWRTPECVFTEEFLREVHRNLPYYTADVTNEDVEPSWVDIWSGWTVALGTWKHGNTSKISLIC